MTHQQAVDTDEGRIVSGQILDTARRMAAGARREVGVGYTEITDPMPMLVASDAEIADILPKEAQKAEGDQLETTTEDSITPFDFEKAFVARHGIKPEEADAPYERGKRSWKEEKGHPDETMDPTTKTSLATSLYPMSEMSALARYRGDR